MNKQRMRYQSGFNLSELLIGIAILGISLTIAIPSFTNLTSSNQLSAQASEIQMALNFARTEAIRLNERVVFCHSSNQSTCSAPPSAGWQGWLIRRAGASVGAETGTVLRVGMIDASKIKVTSDSVFASAQSVIVYNPQGLARTFAASAPLSSQIQVCIPSSKVSHNLLNVRFNSGGRSEIIKVNNSGVCP